MKIAGYINCSQKLKIKTCQLKITDLIFVKKFQSLCVQAHMLTLYAYYLIHIINALVCLMAHKLKAAQFACGN